LPLNPLRLHLPLRREAVLREGRAVADRGRGPEWLFDQLFGNNGRFHYSPASNKAGPIFKAGPASLIHTLYRSVIMLD
jgi:hypothetical protein